MDWRGVASRSSRGAQHRRSLAAACLWSAALVSTSDHCAPVERVLARWKCADVRAPVYLVVRAPQLEVFPSTPDACKEWGGACGPGGRARDGDGAVLGVH